MGIAAQPERSDGRISDSSLGCIREFTRELFYAAVGFGRGLEVDNATPQSDSNRLSSITGLEFRKNVSDMHLNSVFRD